MEGCPLHEGLELSQPPPGSRAGVQGPPGTGDEPLCLKSVLLALIRCAPSRIALSPFLLQAHFSLRSGDPNTMGTMPPRLCPQRLVSQCSCSTGSSTPWGCSRAVRRQQS